MILTTARAQAEAVGVSRWTIQAVRKAGRELGDPVGRYITRRRLLAWFGRHPDFVGAHYLGKSAKRPCKGSDHPPVDAGKPDELSHQHGQHMPSPVE